MTIIAAPYDWRTENACTGYHAPVRGHGSMDLRSIPDQSSAPRPGMRNLGLFCATAGERIPSDARILGEHLSDADRRWLRDALGHKRLCQADTLVGAINWFRTEGADPSGETAMKPAMPDHHGRLAWRLGALRHSEAWTPRHLASVDLFKRIHANIMAQDAPLHRKFLGASVIKTGVDYRTLLFKRMWSETPLVPTTVISETFNTANSTTLGPNHTWTERNSRWEIVSNTARKNATTDSTQSTDRTAYCNSTISSDDMIVRCEISTHTQGVANAVQGGVTARDDTSATTYYWVFIQRDSSSGNSVNLFKCVATTFTSLDTSVTVDLTASSFPAILVDGSTQRALGTNLNASDSAISGQVRGGIYGRCGNSTSNLALDNWEARDMIETAALPQGKRHLRVPRQGTNKMRGRRFYG
jgi:hypothetical protein